MRRSLRVPALLFVACASVACGSARRAWMTPDVSSGPPVAVELWRRASPTEPASAAFADAKRLQGLGRVADAVKRASDAIEADPGYLEAHRLLQDLLARTTADWWLRKRYETRLAEHPDDADGYYLLARIEPDPDRQFELFSEALARDPRHPYARLGRAIVLARRGDVKAALSETRRSAEHAPWLALPWLWLGGESLNRGDASGAERFFGEGLGRDADDPRGWLGLAEAAEDGGRLDSASRAALNALRLAPGDEAESASAVDVLCAASVPADLASALKILDAARPHGVDAGACAASRGRLLLAAGRASDAESAFVDAVANGVAPEQIARPLRLARFFSGRFRDAVLGSFATAPAEAAADDDAYAPRWDRLRAAASGNLGDARALLRLAEAAASVGWLEESRAVLVAARAAAPDDPVVAARAASEEAFGAFIDELGHVARDARAAGRSPSGGPDVRALLARVSEASIRRLGRDVTEGATVRTYPLLGEFAVSAASTGEFETAFGSHGLLCLVGARSGNPTELVLGRMAVVHAGARATVLGREVECDECWLESEGLPSEAAGLRRGLAGLTLDRLVLLQLDVIRRGPRPLPAGLPFLARAAADDDERRALDSPSDVAGRIETDLARRGRLQYAVVDAVRRHELVHVYDAERMLPFAAHPLTALWFVVSHGFAGAAMERALEGRAQALSILSAKEPRLALAGLLAFLPAQDGDTPHAAGYRVAVQIAVDEIIDDPAAFPSIDLSQNVLQQMDRLTDDEVRELGRRIAKRL